MGIQRINQNNCFESEQDMYIYICMMYTQILQSKRNCNRLEICQDQLQKQNNFLKI